MAVYAGRLIVFKPSSIYAVSGTDNNTLFSEQIVTGEGCASGYSIQEVESHRYGNILVFMSSEGYIKAFNGSKNLLQLGDPAKPLFDEMNKSRLEFTSSGLLRDKDQYWCSMTEGSGSTHDRVFIYDYANDIFVDEKGRQLSTILFHIGINANCYGIFTTSANVEYMVTGDYLGFALRQNNGLLDSGTDTIDSKWATGKVDYGAADRDWETYILHLRA